VVNIDVCLEAEGSPRGSLESAIVLPRLCLDVLMPQLGLAWVSMLWPRPRLFCLASTRGIGTFKLRYDIIIHNFHPFILFIYMLETLKTKLHLCSKTRF